MLAILQGSVQKKFIVKNSYGGPSLVVQWLGLCAPNAGGLGSIPGRGTRFYMPQLTKTQCNQINK